MLIIEYNEQKVKQTAGENLVTSEPNFLGVAKMYNAQGLFFTSSYGTSISEGFQLFRLCSSIFNIGINAL